MSVGRLPMSLGDLSLGAVNKCPRGLILRSAYTTSTGVKVPASCVLDQGRPGKTPKAGRVLPKPEAGGLSGWSHSQPPRQRYSALRQIVRRDGCATAIRRLSLLATYTKRTSPSTRRVARGDAAWLREQDFCRLKSKKG